MANVKNGNAVKATNGRAAWLKACEQKVTDFGRIEKAGSTAKQDMIQFYQEECLLGRATSQDAKLFATWYNNGRRGNGKGMAQASLDSFASSLAAFADPRVIKNWEAISATLNKLHGIQKDGTVDKKAKDEMVSRAKTGLDRFNQAYAIAKKIRDMPANVKFIVNDEWVKESVQPTPKASDTVVKAARKAIAEQTDNYFKASGKNELTPAQKKTRDAFFQMLGIL
jgi:hypothetical protein